MADLSDVLTALAQQVVQIVYPNGTGNPSIAGVTVTVGPGWPIREKLDDILRAGNAMISIFPEEKERAGPYFERTISVANQQPATITAIVSGSTITIGGTVTLPQSIVTIVNNTGYGY